jgi:hypothetical protein
MNALNELAYVGVRFQGGRMIPFQRMPGDDGIDAPYMDEQRVQLLREAEQSRKKASNRAKLVKYLWVQSEMATRDKKRMSDAQNPEVADAYGGTRAASDPLYKKYTAENNWLMTRSQTMAINFICEQNKKIIELLERIAGG